VASRTASWREWVFPSGGRCCEALACGTERLKTARRLCHQGDPDSVSSGGVWKQYGVRGGSALRMHIASGHGRAKLEGAGASDRG
jgi:hypothetical protein